MISTALYALMARSPKLIEVTNRAGIIVSQAYCFPGKAQDALDTGQLWAKIIGISLGIISLLLIGIGMFFGGERRDGGEMLKRLGWFIGGSAVFAGAAGIAAIFLGSVASDCKQIPGA
ncbi:hypothetical protein [Clavibacter michiganensis]|uniref:hypothetical protein n=1 Tax=Clavibacter michiganensis TaxID=28447 RepID=UPI00292F185F|nr:hypothetical protein [Clavibacter michiganensis]